MLVYQRVISVTEINGSIQVSEKRRILVVKLLFMFDVHQARTEEIPQHASNVFPHVFVFASTKYWQNCLMFIFSWVNRGSTWFNEHCLTIIAQTHLVGGFNHLETYNSQWEGWHPIYEMEVIKAMFETTNQSWLWWCGQKVAAPKCCWYPTFRPTEPCGPASRSRIPSAWSNPFPCASLEHENRVSSQDPTIYLLFGFLDVLKISHKKSNISSQIIIPTH